MTPSRDVRRNKVGHAGQRDSTGRDVRQAAASASLPGLNWRGIRPVRNRCC